jgi:head-tail adaptor
MQAGRRRHLVSLANAPQVSGDADGFFEPCSPPTAFAAIEPVSPVSADGTRIQGHYVTLPYHPGVTVDTRILWGARALFVKGVQNVDERNRELRCYCEEAI